ncbi:MAG: hypothetical protein AMXMBFR64_43990 [Myxococcales bacterium]
MARLGLETHIVDKRVYDNTIRRFRDAGIVLPTFAQLADPATIPAGVKEGLADVDPDSAHPLNLFRVHWYNAADRRGTAAVPGFVELPSSLTGVDARIVVAVGERFPMIAAHKVLAAYGCLIPRIVTGQYDPTEHRAIWPSTGNYCRGGVAISRILQCRGVAVLPENMSAERFQWLERWVTDLGDIIRTPGSESNVKEIYDECNRLDQDPDNVIFNQFSEFGNHLVHWLITGKALAGVFEHLRESRPTLRLAGFVSATGSGGTIAAGDWLRDAYGSRTVAVEALECPTLLYNGFGEHNIQGIGDKHVPLIHNVYTTDFVAAVSDAATDGLFVLFNSQAGREYLQDRHGLSEEEIASLSSLGFSGICNVAAAIKLAKYQRLDADDVVMTVATDSAAMYRTEVEKIVRSRFGGRFDGVTAGETWGRFLAGLGTDHFQELTLRDRDRVFNLGYYTWVEQQGVSLEAFEARRSQTFWRGLRELVGTWDSMIAAFNAETGVSAA